MDETYLNTQMIYRVVAGSRAYGTHTPTSDRDEKGVALLDDVKYHLGFSTFELKDGGWVDGVDRQIYSLKKFAKLALDCNPNIVEMLWVDPSDILFINEVGQELLSVRERFLSKRAARTFGGYAVSQLHKMNKRQTDGIQVDWKHAYHLVRLLRMGKEILTDGVVKVRRPDAAELLEIRRGAWAYKDLVSYADSMLEELKKAEATSPLPSDPDAALIERLLVKLTWSILNDHV